MKTTITSIIAILAIALWICVNALQETKRELVATQTELELRKDVSWKLWKLFANRDGQLKISVPKDHYSQERPIIITNDKWSPTVRYEFSSKGDMALLFLGDEKAEWSLKVPRKE